MILLNSLEWLIPMGRFWRTDRKTFSRLVQCRTGHAHIGDYYKKFIHSENVECPCGATPQTREHVLKSCKRYYRHRHILGHGRHAQTGRLLGTVKGIRKLITFIKRSGAFDKTTPTKANAQEETGSMREEERELSPERDDETRTAT